MTELLYMQDFDVESCTATINDVYATDDGHTGIILDQTCFYPRGGGQDWGYGTITDGEHTVHIDEVRLDEAGNVHHMASDPCALEKGGVATCTVDHERRQINTRLHSAGHMIDMAVDSLGHDWRATKGQHYPHLSAVEYAGTLDGIDAEQLRAAIELRANELQSQPQDNRLIFMNVDELYTVCRHVPDNIPTNKPCRVMLYGENFGVPCGGTHVRKLSSIGRISVPKIKAKKGIIRVNYAVGGVN